MKYLPVIYVSAALIVGACNQKTIKQTPGKEFPNIMVTDVQKKISAKDNIISVNYVFNIINISLH